MKKRIKWLLILALVAYSCGGDLPPLDDGGHKTPMSHSTSTDSTLAPIESSNNYSSGDAFKLSTTKTNNISPYQQLPYNSDNTGHKMEINFDKDIITATIMESNFKWQNKFTIQGEPNGTWLVDGMLYELDTKDVYGESIKIIIKLDATDNVKWVRIKNRTYSKIASTTSIPAQIKSKLKYMEDNSVEVQKGQTLRILVELYNRENANRIGKTFTISEVRDFNKLGTKGTVRIGQIIEFPKNN